MKKRRKNHGKIPIWQPAIMNAATMLTAGIMTAFGIQKSILNWEAATRLMKGAVALSAGIVTLYYCNTAPENKLELAGSVFVGGVTLLLIGESLLDGQADWNPASGIIICIASCLLGVIWTAWKKPKRGR